MTPHRFREEEMHISDTMEVVRQSLAAEFGSVIIQGTTLALARAQPEFWIAAIAVGTFFALFVWRRSR
jgi:hypothetical protein